MAVSRIDEAGLNVTQYGNRNLIINGAQTIDQRNGGSAVTASGDFATDRFELSFSNDGAQSLQQVADAPTGFQYSVKYTQTTADASMSATQWSDVRYHVEGYDMAHLDWGSSDAKTVTLSFWAKSSLTGTHGGAFANGIFDRAYPFSYNIDSANTWEYKTITVAGDTTGTWAKDNTRGAYIFWCMGVGSTYIDTAGSWYAAGKFGASGQVMHTSTLNSTFQITGVQLEVGDTATPFEHRSYGDELQRCKRYYESSNRNITNDSNVDRIAYLNYTCYSTSAAYCTYFYEVEKRAQPTITHGSANWRIYQNSALLSTGGAGNTDGVGIRNFSIYLTGPTFDINKGGMADYRQFDGIKIDAEL